MVGVFVEQATACPTVGGDGYRWWFASGFFFFLGVQFRLVSWGRTRLKLAPGLFHHTYLNPFGKSASLPDTTLVPLETVTLISYKMSGYTHNSAELNYLGRGFRPR